jgi:hypothetical protein
MIIMSSWQRKGMRAFVLCLAGCSSPHAATVAAGAGAARVGDVGTVAPSGSFRATMVTVETLQAARVREVASAESIRVRRGHALEAGVPESGDIVLVDVASYNAAQQLIESVNTFGVLRSREGDKWSIIDRSTHRLVTVRLSEGSWVRAPRGEYRLRTTGAVVGQPGYYVRIARYASLPATGRIVAYRAAH